MSLSKEEQITKKTYDSLAHEWMKTHQTPQFWKDDMEKFKQLLPGGKILEIGCAAGRDGEEMAKMGYGYVGTDISEKLISLAKKNHPHLTFKISSIYDLDFKDKFDGFWCVATLVHLPKKRIDEALQAIKRNLKPGAIGYLTVKEGSGQQLEKKIDLDGEGRLFSYWQNNEFKKTLNVNGFEVVAENYKPYSERSKWLTYHVQAKA
jgi:SAM-dependent methyltransferase